MSNKLTKEMLDALIKEAITESNFKDFDKFVQNDLDAAPTAAPTPKLKKFDFTLADIPAKIKALIIRVFKSELKKIDKDINTDAEVLKALASIKENSLNEDEARLEWEDFAKILANPDNQLYDNAVRAIVQASNMTGVKNTTAGKALIDLGSQLNLAPAASGASSTIKDPAVPTIDIADAHGGDRTKIPAYVVDLFNNLKLGGVATVDERIKIINNATLKIQKGQKAFQNIGEAVSAVAVAGLMANIAKRMDDKAAGWAFESFLAQLVNGITKGIDMGAADFQWGLGAAGVPPRAEGSAKLISGGQGKFTQSANELSKALAGGESMYYIVGFKSDRAPTARASLGSGTADPSKVAAIDLYIVEVKRKGNAAKGDPSDHTDYLFGAPGSASQQAGISGTPTFTIKGSTPVGTVYLNADLAKVNELSAKALKKVNKDLPKLFQGIEKFRRNTNSYLSSGRLDAGEDAAKAYASLFALINSVFGVKGEQETGRKVSVAQDTSAEKGVKKARTTNVTEKTK